MCAEDRLSGPSKVLTIFFNDLYFWVNRDMAGKRQYQFGPYLFEATSGLLTSGSDRVALRPKIANLLRVLVESAPEVVSKDDLMARVWPDTNVVESGLARNINELRKSLSKEPQAIQTVPKRGYRFTIPVECPEPLPEVIAPPAAAASAPGHSRWARRAAIFAFGTMGAVASASLLIRITGSDDTSAPRTPEPYSAAGIEAEVKKEGAAGYYNWGKWEVQAMRDALVHFRRAASLDARLWYGYVGIADSYLGLLLLANRMDPEWAQWARHAADRAVQLGPNIAIAHCALGCVRLILDWDLKGAEASFEDALRCNPFNYVAYQRRGLLRTLQRRFDEARTDLRKATELKPEFHDAQVFWAWSEFCAGNFDGAIDVLKDLPPSGGKRKQALRILAATHGMKRQFEAARKTLALASLSPGDDLAVRAWLDAREGNVVAAKSGLDRLCGVYARDNSSYCDTAIIDSELGLVDSAFASLERGLQLRHWRVLMLSVDPRLESLHKDPRWNAFCSRIRAQEP